MYIMSVVEYVDIVFNKNVCVEWNGKSGHWPLGWERDVNIGPPPMRLARAISKAIMWSRRDGRPYKVVECFEKGEVRFYIDPWEFSAPTDGKTVVWVLS